METTKRYGLIGYPLGHSFSKRYFTEKFLREGISDAQYELFPLETITDFTALLEQYPDLNGLNVTIPYKQAVIPYLNALSPEAAAIGAVNCIEFGAGGYLTGHNTDATGFRESLQRFGQGRWAAPGVSAFVLGNGGAAKAVFYVLKALGIGYKVVSRKPDTTKGNEFGWENLEALFLHQQETHPDAPVLVVNTTPVGMAPHTEDCPDLPFHLMDSRFLVFDLIYNPEETVLLQRTKAQGAKGLNGLEMLHLQADAAWAIWNKERLNHNMATTLDTTTHQSLPDFTDTATAFAHLSDQELKKATWLFRMMNRPWLVKYGSSLGLAAVEWNLPFAEKIIRHTIFEQFVGGSTLLESKKSVDRLAASNTLTILDYGAEAKETEQDFNHTMTENIRAIDFAAREGHHIPVVSTKITGLARFGLLERIQSAATLNKEELHEYRNALKRLDTICYHAAQKGIAVFIDAEESWIQDALDHLVWLMMKRYNQDRVVVYNTYQLYRNDRLQFLMESADRAREAGFKLGAKLVRGAYMEKERKRAEEMGYPSPINPDKQTTDDHFNTALRFCVDNLAHIAVCNASHNAQSNLLLAELMEQKGLPRDHPHTLFSQLYGMSDNLTFNLAKSGYRAAKYMPYGQVHDVIPYLIRRAQENSSVTGDASRELGLILQEVERREL